MTGEPEEITTILVADKCTRVVGDYTVALMPTLWRE